MKKEPLLLAHKEKIDRALSGLDLEISEYSFADLYLFRKKYEYRLIDAGDLYVEGKSVEGTRFIVPLGLSAWQNEVVLDQLLSEVEYAFPIPEQWLRFYADKVVSVQFFDQDSDYLYDVAKLGGMSGRDLAKKRNLEKQLLSSFSPRQQSLSAITHDDAMYVLQKWQKQSILDAAQTDYYAAEEAISLQKALGLEGMVVYIEEEAVAVLIGEFLNSRVFVVHIAKANTDYKGIYQYLYHTFCQSIQSRCSIINMEQDLGDANLRKTKHSYHPIKMAKKYRFQKRVNL